MRMSEAKDKDPYRVLGNPLEVDSDVNEDPKREKLLDDSFEEWYENMGEQVERKLELTNVPGDSVFDSAVGLDKDQPEDEQM